MFAIAENDSQNRVIYAEPPRIAWYPRHSAFVDKKKRNIDAINALNFAISEEVHGVKVAQEGLRAVLKWRKERSAW